jgi:hypothetical protein
MVNDGAKPILRTHKAAHGFDLSGSLSAASRLPGQSWPRLLWRLIRSSFNKQAIGLEEFFLFGMHRPNLTSAECQAFLGKSAMIQFNRFVNGPADVSSETTLKDKLLTATILAAAGIPVARVRAIYPGNANTLGSRILETKADIVDFLLSPENGPIFGKPVYGAFSLGIVAIDGPAGGGKLHLSDGRTVPAEQLAAEIVRHYSRGYMFQDLLRASPQVRHLSGPVLPGLRVYSLWIGGDSRPVYAVMRMPEVGEVAEDTRLQGGVRFLLDLATGEVLRTKAMGASSGPSTLIGPVTGTQLDGQRIPDWDQILAVAKSVHRQFPTQRSIGIDVALSDHGLIINEANASPLHATYQAVSMEGLLNPKFAPLFREVLAERGIRKPSRGVPWPAG